MNVVMIPSASAGLGHIGRTATLARALRKLDPSINVEYLLDTDRLRPFNIDAAARTGFRVNLLPSRNRENRDAIVRAALGQADVIVDDTQRYLVPLRQIVPRAAWVSIPMYPLGDELFMDWPFLAQVDQIIWAYPPLLDFPPELKLIEAKVLRSGPFIELDGVPERAGARTQLGFGSDEDIVLYAPRGMSFGRDFGERVLAGVIGAVTALREERPHLRLVLVAVNDRAELNAPGVPAELPEWISVLGTLSNTEMLTYIRAADIALTEGSNMTHEAAALGTPITMVPGTIFECWLLGTRLHERNAAQIIWIERVTPPSLADAFRQILVDPARRDRMIQQAYTLVAGGAGVDAAAQRVLDLGAARAQGTEFRIAQL